jgi:hypothetical protein
MEQDNWIAQYKAKVNRLHEFDAGIAAKLKDALGPKWQLASEVQRGMHLTARQKDWNVLRYYFECIANNGDVFASVGLILNKSEAFHAVGATKTLAAAESLRDLYDQYAALKTHKKDAFWRNTETERQPIEEGADNLLEFADLLIAFAEAHPEEFSALPPPANPLAHISEYLDVLKQDIQERRQTGK